MVYEAGQMQRLYSLSAHANINDSAELNRYRSRFNVPCIYPCFLFDKSSTEFCFRWSVIWMGICCFSFLKFLNHQYTLKIILHFECFMYKMGEWNCGIHYICKIWNYCINKYGKETTWNTGTIKLSTPACWGQYLYSPLVCREGVTGDKHQFCTCWCGQAVSDCSWEVSGQS